jgi:hypothetical protein
MTGSGFGAGAAGNGGIRTDCPDASLVAASARRPSTLTCPVRHSF